MSARRRANGGRVLRLGLSVGSGWKMQAHAARVEADGVLEARPLGHVPLRLRRVRVSVSVRMRALSSGASSRALPPARPGGPKIGRFLSAAWPFYGNSRSCQRGLRFDAGRVTEERTALHQLERALLPLLRDRIRRRECLAEPALEDARGNRRLSARGFGGGLMRRPLPGSAKLP